MCPEPEVALPFEIKDLSLHYQEIDESIRTIKDTIQDLSTDSFLVEVKRLSDFLTTDMAEMSNTLDYITQNYDSSLTFFKSFEKNLNTVKKVYVGYKLHYIVYAGISLVGLLLGLTLISVCIKIVQCYPLVEDYMADWSEFRAQCQNLRNEGFGNSKEHYPWFPLLIKHDKMYCDMTP